MRRLLALPRGTSSFAVLAFVLVLAACGGGSSGGLGALTSPATSAPTSSGSPASTSTGAASAPSAGASSTPPGAPGMTSTPTAGAHATATPATATSATPTASSTAPATTAPAGAAVAPAGTFVGTNAGGVTVFKGIPYAQPPVGALRFEPPQPLAPLAGVMHATAFAPACYQKSGPDETIAGPQNQAAESEDCLDLNVYAPSDLSGKKPVDVWIYGGAYAAGYGDPYDGTPYARNGIVFVTFDYRLGIFGFFAHPGLDATSPHHTSGDQGMLDQVAALQWVQKNIAAFGGDPANVTIHGESAGAGSVLSLLASPLGAGLFHRAIAESPFLGFTPAFTTASLENYYSANFPLFTQSIATLQSIPAATLNASQPQMLFDDSTSLPYDPDQYSPSVDGYYLPRPVSELFASGAFNHADLLVGNCDDEGLLFTQASYAPYETTATFPMYAAMTYGADASEAEALYPAPDANSAIDQLGRLYADPIFDYDSRAMARYESAGGNRVFQYVFTRPEPAQSGADTHICEIPFVFSGLYPPTAEQGQANAAADATYSAMIVDALSRFVKTGNPNGGLVTNWPMFDASNESYLEFAASGNLPNTHWRAAQLDFVGRHLAKIPDTAALIRRSAPR